jgi:hypothetical protein
MCGLDEELLLADADVQPSMIFRAMSSYEERISEDIKVKRSARCESREQRQRRIVIAFSVACFAVCSMWSISQFVEFGREDADAQDVDGQCRSRKIDNANNAQPSLPAIGVLVDIELLELGDFLDSAESRTMW